MRMELLEAFGLSSRCIEVLRERYGPELLPLQEKALRSRGFLKGNNLIILAATSAGKTLVGEILALIHATSGKRVVYLVPTKALAEEKFESFYMDFRRLGIEIAVSTHDRREFDEEIVAGAFHIAVVVFEKLASLMVKDPLLLSGVGLVVVQIVGLSAVVSEAEALRTWLDAEIISEVRRQWS